MTTKQSELDLRLVRAVEEAVTALERMLRKAPAAREVRAVLYDISADSGVPLPVSIQVYVPPRTEAIISDNELARLIMELNHIKQELKT